MSSTAKKKTSSPSPVEDATKGHAENLEKFYESNPEFIWGPALLAATISCFNAIPVVADYLKTNNMELFGFRSALTYTLFAVVLSYAFHAFTIMHASDKLKIQTGKCYNIAPNAMAVRSTATIFTSMVYTVLPLAPFSATWIEFLAWDAAFGIYWDFHFYWAHRFAHENSWAYKFFHKTHHLVKDPNCFGAYFVRYQSHVLLEQSVVLLMAYAGLPIDVFCFYLYRGTLGTYLEHAGYELGNTRLPIINFMFGQVWGLLGISTYFLEPVNAAQHDWHHEKFTKNYSLSFTYLDKIFGTFHPGREPGQQVEVEFDGATSKQQPTPTTTATYVELQYATVEDFEIQGKAFDAYQEEGCIVENMLNLVRNMRGKNGEIGANVDMYIHSVQTATRARRAGADRETVVCALLHDIGEVLSGTNHGEIPAAMLRPYISPLNYWVLYNHEVFQAYFYLDKCGGDRDLRDKIKEYQDKGYVSGHPYYDACAKFCYEYDQPSFDPSYSNDSLESFTEDLKWVLDKKPFWWENREGGDMDCKAKLASGYSMKVRD